MARTGESVESTGVAVSDMKPVTTMIAPTPVRVVSVMYSTSVATPATLVTALTAVTAVLTTRVEVRRLCLDSVSGGVNSDGSVLILVTLV